VKGLKFIGHFKKLILVNRHYERSAAIQLLSLDGLPRYARNDGVKIKLACFGHKKTAAFAKKAAAFFIF
jgi:hypothetical protein